MSLTADELREFTLMAIRVPGSPMVEDRGRFRFTINTELFYRNGGDNATYSFTVSLDGVIEWGDGSSVVTTAGMRYLSHTYAVGGIYQITITGVLLGIRLGIQDGGVVTTPPWRSYAFCLLTVNTPLPESTRPYAQEGFMDCINLMSVPATYCTAHDVFLTYRERAFAYCYKLKSISGSFFDSNPQATSFRQTFFSSGLTSIPPGLFSKCENVTNFSECFGGCSFIKSVPDDLFMNNPGVTNFTSCFAGCFGVTSNVPRLWETHPNAAHDGCFRNCTNAANYADIPEDWR